MEWQVSALTLSHHPAPGGCWPPPGLPAVLGSFASPSHVGHGSFWPGLHERGHKGTSHPWPPGVVTGSQWPQESPNPPGTVALAARPGAAVHGRGDGALAGDPGDSAPWQPAMGTPGDLASLPRWENCR